MRGFNHAGAGLLSGMCLTNKDYAAFADSIMSVVKESTTKSGAVEVIYQKLAKMKGEEAETMLKFLISHAIK